MLLVLLVLLPLLLTEQLHGNIPIPTFILPTCIPSRDTLTLTGP